MALTLADGRTILSDCDATTGWSSGSLGTTDPDPVEATGRLELAVSTTTSRAYLTVTAIDFRAGYSPGPSLIYGWFTHRAALDTLELGGVGMYIGDGTNDIVFHMAGKDVAVFRHDLGPALWQCLLLDTASLPATYTVVSGSYASLNWGAITRIGIQFKTLAKSIGGSVNCFWDIYRRGAIGVGFTITAGGSGTEGTFSEIAALDRTVTTGLGYGILREVESGIYGCQGPLTFGSVTSGINTYFKDIDKTLVFEARGIGNDKYLLTVLGNASSGVTNFQLIDCIIKSAGPYVACNFAGAGIDVLTLTRCVFSALGNAISFSPLDADTSGHNVAGCKFDQCGQIDPGRVTFANNIISRTMNANGGLLIDADGTDHISGISFISDGTGHAIYITATGTYTFTNFIYSGYGANDTTDAVVYNNSGGAVTINVSGGDTPTVRNGTSASTTVVSGTVVVKLIAQKADGTKIQDANGFLAVSAGGGGFPYQASVTIVNSGNVATVTHSSHGLATGDKVWIVGASLAANNGVFSITYIGVNSYSYTMASSPGSSPTGTITSTFVFLKGLTDVNGEISLTRVVPAATSVIGWARKSSSIPLYKTGPIAGTVASGSNSTFMAVLSPDE